MRDFYNEMATGGVGSVREHYREFEAWLRGQPADRIERKRLEADLAFRRVGITFAVYGDDAGTERLIPFDTIPRIIPAHEWSALQDGLVQRVKALNMFVHDIYHEQRIIEA